MEFTSRQLRAFQLVAQHHSFTRAADFAAFAMLGLRFCPRIRGVQHQRIYRIDPNCDYGSFASLVSRADQTIDTEQIAEHWDRMNQLYASLKTGHVTASVALKRLVGFSTKNRFYRANRDLGRIFKTAFILQYLSESYPQGITLPPNRYYPSSFLRFTFCTEMKNKRAPEINRPVNVRAPSEKLPFSEQLVRFCGDLENNHRWKYDELSPAQLLVKSKLDERLVDKDELARTEFFWSRRPRLLRATGYIVWFILLLGLPFWLFSVPAIGLPFIIISVVVGNTETVRSVRWRRQYELSIDRLIRHFGRSQHSTPSV